MMGDYQLDTNGQIDTPRKPVEIGGRLFNFVIWSDLSPFAQGYVEALFEGLKMPTNGWRVTYEGRRIGWMLTGTPAQALKKARADNPNHIAGRFHVHAPGFSDLSPEALARVREDCEAATQIKHGDGTPVYIDGERGGRAFWEGRQSDIMTAFRPLTVFLSDDGRVNLREAV